MTRPSPSRPRPERRAVRARAWRAAERDVRLPGGLLIDQRLRRKARFRPITGALEARLDPIARARASVPAKVSALLALALQRLGGQPADEELVGALCPADRKYLMLALASRMAGDHLWATGTCEGCGAGFDVGLRRSELPVKPAGASFPFADVELRGAKVRLRVPSGADQESIAGLPDRLALHELLRRCVVGVGGQPAPAALVDQLFTSPDELALVDAALDEAAPDVGTLLDTACPECGRRQALALDPYRHDFVALDALYEEVHLLASSYHWSEADILALDRDHRRRYLRLIERSRGLAS